jgi:hypothetical protein
MLLSMDTTSFKGTTLNSNYLMPISGAEYGFSIFPWDCDLSSGNCYLYALGFLHAQEQKAQPSDLAMAYPDLVRKFDLRDLGVDLQRGCPDLENSIMADGIAAARIQDGNLGTKRIRESTTTEKTDWKKPASPRWYKMCSVIGAEDFHFLRQDVLDVYELYSTQLHGYHEVASPLGQKYWFGGSLWQPKTGGRGFYKSNDTPYDILGVHPFTSSRYLENLFSDSSRSPTKYGLKGRNLAQAHSFVSGAFRVDQFDPSLNRPRTNIDIHVSRLPEYVLRGRNLLIDPFWFLGVDPFVSRCLEKVMTRQGELQAVYAGDPAYTLHLKTVTDATLDCLEILRRTKGIPPKHALIGPWSQKAGFGTGALNTDGNFKMILDPSLACRCHGSINYKTVCSAFQVLYNHGQSGTLGDVF